MAFYGKTSRAVQDGARNSRTEQLKQQVDWNTLVNPTPAQAAVQRDYQKQLENEAKWAAEQEEKRRQERVAEKEKYANPSPQAKARKAQEKADLQAGVGQQQDYSTAWQNLIGQPENLVSNGQTIQNRETGEQVSVPNRSQAQSQQRSAEPQTTTPQTPAPTPATPTPVETAAPEPVEEETNTNVAPRTTTPVTQTATEEQQETVGEQPRTTTTTAPRTRGYERAEEPFLNGVSTLVEDQTPLVRSPYTPYNPPTRREQNPADTNPAGLPSTPAQTYYDWQNYVAQLEAAERANDELFRQSVQPDTSVLGNGYVRPITINTNPSALAGAPDLFNGGSYLPATVTPVNIDYPLSPMEAIRYGIEYGVPQRQNRDTPGLVLPGANALRDVLNVIEPYDYVSDSATGPRLPDSAIPSFGDVIDNIPTPVIPGANTVRDILSNDPVLLGANTLREYINVLEPYDYITDDNTGPKLPGSAIPSFGDVVNAIVSGTPLEQQPSGPSRKSSTSASGSSTPARVVDESNYGTTPERARALEVAQSMGLFGPEAVEYADYLVKNGGSLYRWSPNEDAIRSKAEEAYLDNLFETENEYELTQEQMNARRREAEAYANDVVNNYRVGTPGEQRYDARQGTGGQSSPLDQVLDDIMNGTAPGAGSTSTNTGTGGSNSRMTPEEFARYYQDRVGTDRLMDDLMQMNAPGVDANGNLNTAAQALFMGTDQNDPYSGTTGTLTPEQRLHLFDRGGAFSSPNSGVNVADAFADLIASNPATAVGSGNPNLVEWANLTPEQYTERVEQFLEANPLIEAMAANGLLNGEGLEGVMNNFFRGVPGVNEGNANSSRNGNTTTTPSYEQGGSVVKAPYKAGGYTEAEIRALGNNPYVDANGRTQYEGYYYWNGKYYPVDQEKAAYYQKYHTYDGWEEPMRDYYNTFGTFYGYRPDWKTAGRNVSSGTNYSSPSTSYRSGSNYNRGYYNSYYNNPVGNRGETNPTVANRQDQRINNIMKNWTF